ncbi:MAG: catalase family protein [Ramlibacter sp.]|nr:catalase family protein [Ramlibacter sp.]
MTQDTLAREAVPPDEAACTADLAARLKSKIIRDNAGGMMRRDAHPKMHGVVRAEFIVEPDLPPELAVGVFSRAATYRAWIRFSNQNGTIQPDSSKDIRGMAIKLMGVPGHKLLEGEEDEQTQDFIVISTNVFVTRDVKQFDGLIKALTGSLLAKLLFFATHWRVIRNLWLSMRRFANPLQIRYWSTTPYLLGSRAVKYSAIPVVEVPDALPEPAGDDFLREAMVRQLAAGEARFDFAVQLQTDAATMPIEDPGAAWSEVASPFRKVATIKVLQQQFDSEAQRMFGENLSYTPWHSLPEHRPLGGINRARKVVYRAISMFRHDCNGAPRREPTGWDL